MSGWRGAWLAAALVLVSGAVGAVTVQFNSTGGTTATNGLHFYIEDTTKIQARRLNNTGQVYSPTATPPNNNLDNGIFVRANGRVYGPDHNVNAFNPSGGMYNTYSISAESPANPSSPGVQQIATGNFGITAGPQVTVVWKYTTPLDFLTAEVTLTIPTGYAVSAANPVRYYHVFDTYLGGSDNGCGVSFVDANGQRMIGTYPPASGTTCPSSTSIPSGVSVVESFRERDGLNFSNYCAAGWATFFVNGSPNCSVLQSSVMSNTVTTSYQDTGIGIEFDFTASGTYTFSYDFVVGSPNVPPYDHLEIRHDGAATLCPENVTVLACTSTTVPCPIANLVNTGTLTGDLTVTPSSPAVTVTPATFSLGSANTTATVVLQGTAPGGTYSLGTSNPSRVPLSGTKCWNTATSSQSCSLVVSNVSCVSNFECLETGVAYTNLTTTPTGRNPLYTKLAGTNFKIDIVALQSGGAPATGYAASANVRVELFDDSASPQPACSAYTSPVATSAITFVAGDNGRKTLPGNFNLPGTYRKLRCRVTDANQTPNVVGCSSDDFAVRPSSVSIATTPVMATPPSATATPAINAGASFTLNGTATTGYSGTLALDTGKLTAQTTAQDTTVAAGGVVGALTPATLVANASATNNAAYSEAGYLYLAAGTYVDQTFTAVDRSAGDCITDTTSDNNLSTGLVGSTGRYGCDVGTLPASFGRFIPDHFTTAPAAQCGGFAYSGRLGTPVTPGQPFTVTATANNVSGGTTANYASSYAKAVNLTSSPALGSLYVDSTAGGTGAIPASRFVSGVGTVSHLAATGRISYVFTTFPTAGTTITLHAEDAETSPSTGTDGSIAIRSGRLLLANAFGPERSNLLIPVQAQYWSGSSWLLNAGDTCTTIPAASVALSNYLDGKGAAGAWTTTASGATLAGGRGNITLTAPNPAGSTGSVDLAINLGTGTADQSCLASHPVMAAPASSLAWLRGRNGNCAASNTWSADPSARASFGIYPAENRKAVHVREMF